MFRLKILLAGAILIMFISPCFGGESEKLLKENAQLRQRVEKLEQEMAELKKMVMQQASKQLVATELTPSAKLSDADLQRIIESVEKQPSDKNPVWSNLDIQVYGYIKADASYDTSRTYPGNYAVWADSESSKRNDNEFNMTANQTRLGLKIGGPEDNGIKTSGRLEFDLYGSNGAENKAKIQMRHAYLQIDSPDDNFSLLAGQTSDVISPLVPSTLNYTVLWDAGNIGYRRPQIRLTKVYNLKNDVDLKVAGAIARSISNDYAGSVDEAGADSGQPSFQGRIGVTFPWLDYKPTTIGFSGHYGKEEYDINTSGTDNKKFDSWSLNLDLTQPINEWLTLKAEAFTGKNLGTYFGGIGQGVNTTKLKEIAAKGGWVAASLGPWDKWSFNVGAGLDDVYNGDIEAQARSRNSCVFGNVIYSVNKNTQVGFELSQWQTKYKDKTGGDSLRAQTSFIYKF